MPSFQPAEDGEEERVLSCCKILRLCGVQEAITVRFTYLSVSVWINPYRVCTLPLKSLGAVSIRMSLTRILTQMKAILPWVHAS
jgi:hypothetical protein